MVSLGRDLIASMNGKKLSVTRFFLGEYVDGVFVDATAPETVEVLATVVPLSPADIKNLPQGARSSDSRKLYSADPLQVIEEETQRRADLVLIDGKTYKVISVAAWPDFWEAIVVLANSSDLVEVTP